jgi:murein DD-endopeptidase MepM/ murein hydrolase activator NlpD
MWKVSLFIIILLCACVPQRFPRKESVVSYPLREIRYYQVKKNDTLWSISQQLGVDVDSLMEKNNITSPNNLVVGQLLTIPHNYPRGKSPSFVWPLKGEIINLFGERVNNVVNKGINIKTDNDKKVKAAEKGKVVFSNYLKGWGKTLILKHRGGFYTVYANLKETFIDEGLFVKKGEVIGSVGSDDNTESIFHFEIRRHHLAENPLKYLN